MEAVADIITEEAVAGRPVAASTNEQSRYAKTIEVSKRIRWDIDRDVIRGRRFDFGKKFLPDGLSKLNELAFTHAGRASLPEPDPGPHLREHLRPGRALHRRQDARDQPRPLARRPDGAGSAGPVHRRGTEAPGDVPPARGDGGRGHAGRLPLHAAAQRCRQRCAGQVDLGRARPDARHRALHAGALPRQHRPRPGALAAVEGRLPVPLEGRVAARDPGRTGVEARKRPADSGRARRSASTT